jgi:glyoxylase-like metal-dependent hydrolase (beta-lactamase superfamily II)/rhodanese-related sulfurtransferase
MSLMEMDVLMAPGTVAEAEIASFTAADLYRRIVADERLFILDVRNGDDYERWHIEGRASLQSVNVPYYDFIEDEEAAVARVPHDVEVHVVCAKEGSARYVAEILQQHGRAVRYLQDGIASWGDYYDVREVVKESFGRIVQVARPARGDLSFVILSEGQAAIVDPLRHIDAYLEVVGAARLTHIFDTHAHADHISGGPALARQTGGAYFMHPYDAIHPIDMLPATVPYQYLSDGQSFQVGRFTVSVIWFPGHTLGQVNYLFTAPGGESFLFSGDGVFLESFGRPDLGGQAERWTPILYESLFERLPRHVNDDTLILPAHFSRQDEGDERGLFALRYGTVRRQNNALKPRSLAEFTEFVLSKLPYFPPEYVQIKRVNAGLWQPTEAEAGELELGKNICALSEPAVAGNAA